MDDDDEWTTVPRTKRKTGGPRMVTQPAPLVSPSLGICTGNPAVNPTAAIPSPPSPVEEEEEEGTTTDGEETPFEEEEEARRVSAHLLEIKISKEGGKILPLAASTAAANCSTAATWEDLASVDFSVDDTGKLVQRSYELHYDVDVKIHQVEMKTHGSDGPNPDQERLRALMLQTRNLHAEEFEERFEEQCSKKSGYKLVLMSEKGTHNLLAFVMYKVRPDQKTLCISKLAVPRNRRRQGHGQRMMKFIMKFARDNFSRKQVASCALSALPESIKFYQSLGFKQEKARRGGGGCLETGAGFVPGQAYMTHVISNKCKFK